MKKIILIPAIAGLLFVAGANAQNLLSNGSFEDPSIIGGESIEFPFNVADWDHYPDPNAGSDGGFIVEGFGDGFAANEGVIKIKFETIEIASDAFNVTAGQFYDASIFAYDVNLLTSGQIVLAFVWYDAGGSIIGGGIDFSDSVINIAGNSSDNNIWFKHSRPGSVEAPSGAQSASLFIKTQSLTSGGGVGQNAIFLDSASVTAVPVPEPSTYAMIAGFLAFGFVAVRRRMTTK